MSAIEPNLPALLIFGVLWAVACLAFLHLSGMLPLEARPHGTRGLAGAWLVTGNGVLFLSVLVGTISYAWTELRWTSIIVVGGLEFLFLPGLLQACPSRLRESRASLVGMLTVQAGAISLLAHLA